MSAAPKTAAILDRGNAKRRLRRRLLVLALGLLTIAIAAKSLTLGAMAIPIEVVTASLKGLVTAAETAGGGLVEAHIVLTLRLPRVLMGLLIGATLAASGAALQGLLRNPLADPGLVGVSAGAALGAVAVIVFGEAFLYLLPDSLRPSALPMAAFTTGLATTFVVHRLASDGGVTHVAVLLLAGIAINAIVMAAIGYGVFVSTDQQLRDLQFWTLGSLAGASWHGFALPASMMLVALLGLWRLAGDLNALALGEVEAAYLGIDVERLKRRLVLLVALGVGSTVAVAGIIGFVGLVVPHLTRLLAGLDHRYLMPAAMLMGGGLLVMADSMARLVVLPAELPIGIITATIGGPFFLALLLLHRRRLTL